MRRDSQPEGANSVAGSATFRNKDHHVLGVGVSLGKFDSSNIGSSLTRRQMFRILCSGALLAAAGPISTRAASRPSRSRSTTTPTLQAFPLTDVRLLDGPFLEAQQRDEA